MSNSTNYYVLPTIPEVKFGRYPQKKDGALKDIEWYAFYDDDREKVLLFSKFALDCRPYSDTASEEVTWETCSLRKWLNEDFLDIAFSDEEKNAIAVSKLINSDSPNGGNDTYDRIFLLSVNQIVNRDAHGLFFLLLNHINHLKNLSPSLIESGEDFFLLPCESFVDDIANRALHT